MPREASSAKASGLPGAGSLAPGMVSVGVVGTVGAAEARGLAESAAPVGEAGSAAALAAGRASAEAAVAAEKPGVAAVLARRPLWAEAVRALRRWERAVAMGIAWGRGIRGRAGAGTPDGGSAAEQVLGIGLELV
jgi:hypothetical protein